MIDYALLGLTIAVLLAGVVWACLSANPHKQREDEAEETGGDVEARDGSGAARPAERPQPIDSSRWPATSKPGHARFG